MRKRTSERGSDRDLIQRIAARDAAAAAELFDRFAPEIFAVAARRTGAAEAEDVLQEVFARALRGASSFRGDSSLRTWLHSIARYTLYERNRAQLHAETLGALVAAGPGPETLAIAGEQRRRLLAALEKLPLEQALVLEMHQVEGLTHEAIGKTLGIQPAASRKRLQRAVAALKRAFGPVPGEDLRHSQLDSWRASLLRRLTPGEEDHDEPTRELSLCQDS